MALSTEARRAIAIRNAVDKKTAANDDAPKAPRARLRLPNVTTTLLFDSVTAANTTNGKRYMALKGCPVTLADGKETTRTVMVFEEAYDAVYAQIQSTSDTVVELAHTGGTMKVVGLMVDGVMVAFAGAKDDQAELPLAA